VEGNIIKMVGKIIEYKFIDHLGMSYNDWYGGEEPKLKYITIKASEGAKFAYKFLEILGDHLGSLSVLYCGNCDASVSDQENFDSCDKCGHYFIKTVDVDIRKYLRNQVIGPI